MFVRDVYLQGGILSLGDGDVIVDLGANAGNFINLALAVGPRTRVIAVEPSAAIFSELKRKITSPRATLLRGYFGEFAVAQTGTADFFSDYSEAPQITENDILRLTGPHIAFLKCDIEGGEFAFNASSPLLYATHSIAIEIHSGAGSIDEFEAMLRHAGFGILQRTDSNRTAVILAKKRT